jgi:hypothetical protein
MDACADVPGIMYSGCHSHAIGYVVHLHAACASQVLKLPAWDRCGAAAAALTGLQHLPRLSYLCISNSQFILHDSVLDPVLSKLAFLQHLELQHVRLLPSLLVPLTQLQRLRLWHEVPFDADGTASGRCTDISISISISSRGANSPVAGMCLFALNTVTSLYSVDHAFRGCCHTRKCPTLPMHACLPLA